MIIMPSLGAEAGTLKAEAEIMSLAEAKQRIAPEKLCP
jgi:hypothetical protein